jgi:hypothetical protein
VQPIQEILVHFENRDVGDITLYVYQNGCRAHLDYRVSNGHPFEPTLGPLWPTPIVGFGWAVATALEVGKVRNTTVRVIDNPNNTEFLPASDQAAELARRGISADVTVNGEKA